jgi:DNA-binding NtrC family response regulator
MPDGRPAVLNRSTSPRVADDPNTEVAAGSPNEERAQRIKLLVTAGPDQGKTWEGADARMCIGTQESNPFVLTDRTVSRFHCELSRADGGVRIRDLGSKNRTYVDGVQIYDGALRSGQTLQVGNTRIKVDLRDESVSVPLSQVERFGSLVGRSKPMRAAFALLEQASRSDVTVLLLGETGTGKEGAAEAVHQQSVRGGGPFMVVDCGAVPAELLESELFGHEKGAFTGAAERRIGAFEAAHGGTLFLDEVGELRGDLQPKLLRAIEKREIKRVGSNTIIPIDVRLVAATHRDLRREVNEGAFRADLYYRLAVLEVRLPPLREHLEDIGLLVDELVRRMEPGDRAGRLGPSRLAELQAHTWPGNVRELRNYLERVLVWPTDEVPAPESPKEAPGAALPNLGVSLKVAREQWNRSMERQYLTKIMERAGGNVSAAARIADVDRMYFYRRLWMHGLK